MQSRVRRFKFYCPTRCSEWRPGVIIRFAFAMVNKLDLIPGVVELPRFGFAVGILLTDYDRAAAGCSN